MEKFLNVLKTCPMFKNLTDREILDYLNCVKTNLVKYTKDSIIFSFGDLIDKIGIVVKGSIIIYKEDIDANRTIISKKHESSIFGETFVFSNKHYPPFNIMAFTDSEILFIQPDDIYSKCYKNCSYHNMIIKNMLGVIANNNLNLNDKIDILSAKTTRDKLIVFFEQMVNENRKKSFCIDYNREQLADFLNLNRSSMSRELSKMQDEGLIKFKKNRFDILY